MSFNTITTDDYRRTPRPASAHWRKGDVFTDPASGIRWAIRTIRKPAGEAARVDLESMNVPGVAACWRYNVPLDLLPPKPHRHQTPATR